MGFYVELTKYEFKGVMKMLPIKICGMRDAENIRQVGLLAPTYMGFIFYDKSPRYFNGAVTLDAVLPTSVKRVGVFVNASVDQIKSLVQQHGLSLVQLHGGESVEVCAAIKDLGVEVIKVFSVDQDFNFDVTKAYKAVSDYFLFDTKGKYYGGNAIKFDWSILEQYDQEKPFFLSGGIGPEDAASIAALPKLNIHALDINSGVEVSPGVKDIKKITLLQQNFKQILSKSEL
jgi:phosphoribosylanthranilate isomerase